jgi:hypothetical protein
MNMNEKIVQEILHELFSSLEDLDTRSTAVLQFLKDKGTGGEGDLAPYLTQAGNASSVRWRAVRVRIDYLLSSAMQGAEPVDKKESPKPQESREESKDRSTETSRGKETEKGAQAAQPVGSSNKTEASDVNAGSEKNRGPHGNNTEASQDAGTNANVNEDRSKWKDDSDRASENTNENTKKNAA